VARSPRRPGVVGSVAGEPGEIVTKARVGLRPPQPGHQLSPGQPLPAEEDVYLPRWSEQILDEVRRNLPALAPDAVERRIRFMNAAFAQALVTGYEHLIG
jgi:hypothetical protein